MSVEVKRGWTYSERPIYEIRIPRTSAPSCLDRSPTSQFMCTRARGHSGRHAATGTSREVFEVWP